MTDRGFCSPIIDEAEVAAKKKKEEMDREIELIKKEYEEKQKKKKAKEKKSKEKDAKEDKDSNEDKKEEEEKDEKVYSKMEPMIAVIDLKIPDQSHH